MKEMTQANMINAFGGESQAHMRYLYFAIQADKEGMPNTARLFRAVAHAEFIHAGDHFRELKNLNGGFVANSGATFGPGDTKKNLGLAIMGEAFEIAEMYPVYMETAKYQGEKGALRSFEWSYKTEIEHKRLFDIAKLAADAGKDVSLPQINVCETCGFTIEGEMPDECPICKAKREKFKAFK
jgi:rubrerythrin